MATSGATGTLITFSYREVPNIGETFAIDWIKIDCICGIACHDQIIGNYPFFQSKGIDVIEHLSNLILQN